MKKVLFGVCGSVAAYRSPDVLRRMKQMGFELEVLMTASAHHFVTPKLIESFMGKRPLDSDPFSDSATGTDHIRWARWADVIVVYAATMHTMAQVSMGLCNEALPLQIAAFRGTVVWVPAMNTAMWENPATKEHVARLLSRGHKIVGPVPGTLACGEVGDGHIASVDDILQAIDPVDSAGPLEGVSVLLTMGPMSAPIDEVRMITNRSSGRMGFELFSELREAGADVSVLCGSVEESLQRTLREEASHFFSFRSFEDYVSQLDVLFPKSRLIISAAAVLDWVPQQVFKKLPKDKEVIEIGMRRTHDVIAGLALRKQKHQRVVGFALETGDDQEALSRGMGKRQQKSLDLCLVNLQSRDSGIGSDQSRSWIVGPDDVIDLGKLPKRQIAAALVRAMCRIIS